MTRHPLLVFVFFLCFSLFCNAEQTPQRLADFHRVVVADEAFPVTKYAATELAHYVGRILGREVEVIPSSQYKPNAPGLSFFVGDKASEEILKEKISPWKTEEWMLRTIPQGLVLAGDDRAGDALELRVAAGSQLAVYTFLDETLGVKWFWPGPLGEYVPSSPAAELPFLQTRQKPEFIIRSYQVGYPRYHTARFTEDAAKWKRRTRQGWVATALFRHSWTAIFGLKDKDNAEALLKKHPDWFALVNGRRQLGKMCTTNPEVIERIINHVLADDARTISTISPSDGSGFCECERCRALDIPGLLSYDGVRPQLSDRIFTYANEIARRVREKDPAKGVGMYAYTFYNTPPVKIEKLESNIYLAYVFQAMAHVDPKVQEEWKQATLAWKKVSPSLVMREGWGNHYLIDMPFPHDNEIITEFSFGAECNFLAAYGEGSKAFSTQAPNAWAITRMMWNPRQDTTNLMRDFYQSAYGPAADAMQAYFGTFRKAIESNWPKRRFITPTRGMAYLNIINSWDILYPSEVLEEAEGRLKEAAALAPPGEYSDRVAFAKFGFDYTRTMLELIGCYQGLANFGVKMQAFENLENFPKDGVKINTLLRRAYELGEKREDLLLRHRDWAAIDEGLYAYVANNPKGLLWHTTVKKHLGITTPSRVTEETLKAE